MLNSRPVRLLWHSLNWLTRVTIVTTAVTAVLCAIIILTLRYWLLPDIEQFHGRITSSLASAMGNPVSIAKIEGNWDGLHPHLTFTEVRILDKQGQPALVLPRIDASVSWLSLLAAELRLSSLEIERPELLIRRDATGKIFIGSVAIASEGTDNDLANWMLHQSRMVVRNAVIVWLDEQRGAPPLVLDQVNLRIENLFSHHQFALRAVPPIELATPLDVRGDFHGRRFDDLNKWQGQLFAQLDYTDLLAWRPWLKLPPQLSSGRGAIRGWLGVENGKITQMTTDLVLRDVSTRLTDNLPEMDVHFLRGRAAWKTVEDGWEVSTRHLTMRLHNGVKLQPTDFYFRTTQAGKTHAASGELRANLLQLESLVSLANFLPLEAGLRSQLSAYAPRGRVSELNMSWQGAPEKLTGFKIKGQFENLAMQQAGNMPGFSGLSVAVDGNEASGNLNINTRNLILDAPGVMREPLLFRTLTGQAHWQREHGELNIKVANVAVANDDLAGNLYGSFQTKANTLGIVDLTVSLTRGEIRHAARYTPLVALSKKDNDWLNEALLSGHTEDFHLRLKGNLSDFPLDETKDASLEIGAHAQNVSMEFARDWPKIENLSGEFLIHNNKLEVRAPSATLLGARISHLSIIQPDMSKTDPVLEIKGEAEAANNIFLQFIQQSPVRGYINGFTDGISASGNGHLDLSAQIPLTVTKPVKIAGLLRVQASDIDLGAGVPWLRNTRGELSFTESGMKTNAVTADILGGPAHLNVQTAEGGVVHASLQGRTNLEVLRKTDTNPLLGFLHGGAAWDANISVVKKIAQVTLNSNLQGLSSTLPAPFTKSANEIWPLHIEKKNIADKQDMISAQLGKLLSARLLRSDENGVSTIKRGIIRFGGQDQLTDSTSTRGKSGPSSELRTGSSTELRTGIWLTGKLPVVALQGWEGLTGGAGQAIPIAGANLHIDKLVGYGMNINDLQINATKRGDGLAAQLSSTPVNGEVVWQPQGFNGVGKLSAHLRNLYWSGEELANPSMAKPAPTVRSGETPHKLPAMEISIDDLLFKGKPVGRFELTGAPEGQDWRLHHLHIVNPDGSVTGDGLWRSAQTSMQTQVNLLMDISNAGKILARSGYPNTVKNGSGKLSASLTWDGQPDEFNYASLDGTLKLDTGRGQFLKMDPGFGKLLGILSLQALPKRITLDFTDVFSKGF
ncbi:MAG: YhdP family protein, partial [Gallionella sp.]|nr:YhdP family protein [Gallionella sp.]